MGAGSKPAARDEKERALLVDAEPSMHAKAGRVFELESVAHDVTVPRHAMRIGAVVGPHRNRDLRRRPGRQPDGSKPFPGEHLADPLHALKQSRDCRNVSAFGFRKIKEGRSAIWGNDDIRGSRRLF